MGTNGIILFEMHIDLESLLTENRDEHDSINHGRDDSEGFVSPFCCLLRNIPHSISLIYITQKLPLRISFVASECISDMAFSSRSRPDLQLQNEI